MTKLTCLLFCLLFTGVLSAQTYSSEFGKVGKDDLELKSVPDDPDAEAVVMFDYGDSQFLRSDNGFDVLFDRSTRLKVLTDAGTKFTEFEIPLYHEGDIYEVVRDLEAYTYNLEEGRLVKTPLDMSTVYVEKINEYWSVKKFAMPNVKPGSIVECRYKLTSQYVFNLRDWEFQWRIPVIYSQYTVHINPFYYYVFRLQGAAKTDVFEKYEDYNNSHPLPYAVTGKNDTYVDVVYKFGMRNVPAFRDEEFITSVNDYIMKIDFQLAQVNMFNGVKREIMTTWEELAKQLSKHEDFGRVVNKSEKAASKIFDLEELQGLEVMDRFNRVIDYVKTNYSWNGQNGKYASKNTDRLMKEKIGNDADLNLFATGLLNAAGIEATPLISSTREHGSIQVDHPFANAFNYTLILAKIGDKVILTDATEPMLLNNRIPARCINNKGLTIDPNNLQWIGLDSRVPSYYNTDFKMNVEPTGRVKVTARYSFTEYEGFYYRNLLRDDKDKIEKNLAIGRFDFDPASVSVENMDDKKKPYTVSFEQEGQVETINGKIYINPFLSQSLNDNPLKQKTRTYPIDMTYPKMKSYKAEITIPEGYEVSYTPQNKSVDNEYYSLFYQSFKEENKLVVNMSYLFKNAVYQPNMYTRMRLLFNDIIKLGTDKVVLAPKSEETSSTTEMEEPKSSL